MAGEGPAPWWPTARPTEMFRTSHHADWTTKKGNVETLGQKGSRITRLGCWGPIRAMPKRSPPKMGLEYGLVYFFGDWRRILHTQGSQVSLLAPVVFRFAPRMVRS